MIYIIEDYSSWSNFLPFLWNVICQNFYSKKNLNVTFYRDVLIFKIRLSQIISWFTIRFKNFNLHLSQQLLLKIQLQQNAWKVNSKKRNIQIKYSGWNLDPHWSSSKTLDGTSVLIQTIPGTIIHPFIHLFINLVTHSFLLLFTFFSFIFTGLHYSITFLKVSISLLLFSFDQNSSFSNNL